MYNNYVIQLYIVACWVLPRLGVLHVNGKFLIEQKLPGIATFAMNGLLLETPPFWHTIIYDR